MPINTQRLPDASASARCVTRGDLIWFSELLQQSPQFRFACLSSFYLSAQKPHDRRYAKSGRDFSTAVVSRRFHEASFSCI